MKVNNILNGAGCLKCKNLTPAKIKQRIYENHGDNYDLLHLPIEIKGVDVFKFTCKLH